MGQYFSSSSRKTVADHAGGGATAAGGDFKWQEQQLEKRSRKGMKHAYDASNKDDLVLVVSLDAITKIGWRAAWFLGDGVSSISPARALSPPRPAELAHCRRHPRDLDACGGSSVTTATHGISPPAGARPSPPPHAGSSLLVRDEGG
uniref:Uncharacterized protein n=1 Tax=Leersia perrieri TaxID=77586 RepID=A0A0D9XZQ8_9ORYZ